MRERIEEQPENPRYLTTVRGFGYVMECEQRYGEVEVERTLDALHSLSNFGVDRYKRPARRSLAQERVRLKDREAYLQAQVNEPAVFVQVAFAEQLLVPFVHSFTSEQVPPLPV